MKSVPRLLAASLAFLVFVLPPVSAQPASGTIEGRVFSAATGAALGRARVVVEGTAIETLTESDGSYRLASVAAGTARIAVSYVGFDRQIVAVPVAAGGVASRDIELALAGAAPRAATGAETVRLDAFSVVADREMTAQAVALNEQRSAANIKNVVAIDEFGDRGDENIGEFLRFLPGVALNDSGQVPNEVTLRGFPATTSSIFIDGGTVAGSRGGDTRALSLLEVPSANISRVEVTKVPTPDMPASGLGGFLNVISKGGFEVKRPRLDWQVYQIFHDRTGLTLDGGARSHIDALSPKYVQPSANFSYLHPLSKNLAVTVGASRTWRLKPMERGADSDETANWDLVGLFLRSSDWQSLSQILKTWSVNAGADWRLSPRDTLSFGVQYRESDSYITRSIFTATYGAGATGGQTFTQGAATAVGSASQATGTSQDILTATTLANLKYTHRADAWRAEAAANWSRARSDWLDVDKGHFNTAPSTFAGLRIRGDAIPSSSGIIPTRYTATLANGTPADLFDGGNYSIGSATSQQNAYATDIASGRLDFTREFRTAVPFSLKTGAAIERREHDNRRFLKTWNFRPNGATDVAARRAANFPVFDHAFNAEAPAIYGQPMRWISVLKLYDLFRAQPSWFVLDEPLEHQNRVTNSRRLVETVSAAYLRGDVRLLNQRLWLVGGVRFEKTEDKGWGPRNDPSAQYQKDARGSVIDGNPALAGLQPIFLSNDPLVRARQRYVERGTNARRDYDGLYPSLNASFNLAENFVLRAAYARTIGRPNIGAIVPGATFTEPTVATPSVTVTNTGLKPWTADSYDLSLESYHFKDTFASFGVFRKNIRDFFGATRSPATAELLELYGLPADPLYLGYEIVSQANIGDARIDGVEYSLRHALTWLPHWARGLQVFVNGTKMSLGGSTTADFTGFNPSSLAGGVNFIRPRYFVKLTVTHQGETRRGAVAANAANGIPAGTFNYQDARTRWTLSAQYSLTKRLSLYGSYTDLGDGFNPTTLRYAPTTPAYARPQRYQELGSTITLGVKGNF